MSRSSLVFMGSETGHTTDIGYDFELGGVKAGGRYDSFIVSCEDGFSPLGALRPFFAEELGIPEIEISEIAAQVRGETRVSLACLASRRPEGKLKGVVLAAGETSQCYTQFAEPVYGLPYRDFYYNVAYESIRFAGQLWKATRIALTHLSASGRFNETIATCCIEALGHYSDGIPRGQRSIQLFDFTVCCITREHLSNVPKRLQHEGRHSVHRDIGIESQELGDGVTRVFLDW